MLKMFYRKLNRKKDYRFLDAEIYRKQRKSLREEKAMFELSEQAALKVNFCSVAERSSFADIDYFFSSQQRTTSIPKQDQGFIEVDKSPEKQSPPSFYYKDSDTYKKHFEINDIAYSQSSRAQNPFNYYDEIETARTYRSRIDTPSESLPSLGVFSDNKAYSAFVKTELSKLDVDLRHFNHPNSLKPANYCHLDKIDAWIVFLSDESEELFLDEFLDRYIDKPTLFLVPKTKRKASSMRISQFVDELRS